MPPAFTPLPPPHQVGHPVAIRLRQSQIASLTAMWRKARLPPGHAGRGGLPTRCDRQWFGQLLQPLTPNPDPSPSLSPSPSPNPSPSHNLIPVAC